MVPAWALQQAAQRLVVPGRVEAVPAVRLLERAGRVAHRCAVVVGGEVTAALAAAVRVVKLRRRQRGPVTHQVVQGQTGQRALLRGPLAATRQQRTPTRFCVFAHRRVYLAHPSQAATPTANLVAPVLAVLVRVLTPAAGLPTVATVGGAGVAGRGIPAQALPQREGAMVALVVGVAVQAVPRQGSVEMVVSAGVAALGLRHRAKAAPQQS